MCQNNNVTSPAPNAVVLAKGTTISSMTNPSITVVSLLINSGNSYLQTVNRHRVSILEVLAEIGACPYGEWHRKTTVQIQGPPQTKALFFRSHNNIET